MLKSKIVLSCLMLIAVSAINAQTLEITDVLGTPGGTGVVDINYTMGGNLATISVQLQWDPALLTPQTDAAPNPNVNGCVANTPPSHTGTFTACNNPSPGNIALSISDQFSGTVLPTTTPIGTITFDIDGSVPPGTNIPVTVTFLSALDDTGSAITAGNVTLVDGSVTTEAPAGDGFYASTPAPGGELPLGSAVVGDTTTPAVNLNVQNPSPDTDFDVTAFTTSDGQLNSPTPATVPFGDNVDFPFDCTPTARGSADGSFDVEHDSVNGAASPVNYTFTCAGLAPFIQVPAGPVSLNGITVDPADPSSSVTIINNNSDGFSSIANNLTATAGAGDTEITVTGGPINLAPGDVFNFTVTCDRTTAGTFTRTIDFVWDNPDPAGDDAGSIEVNCVIINEIAEYESVPAPGSTLEFGAVLNGDTSAPLGVDIGNSDSGDGVPNATLEITGATITGPDAAVFSLATDPTGTMIAPDVGPDGTPDAEVTCSPTDGFSTFTATLTISSNDPDGDVTYPLTCDGDSDAAVDSNPPAGGTVNFGVVPPGVSSDTTITLTNTGTTDDITLESCTLTADPEITLVSPASFPVTIGPGASTDIVLNCEPTSPGIFTGTLSCEATDVQGTLIPLDYDLTCTGQAIEVPTLSRTGLLAMVLALMAVGFIGFRLRQN